MLKRFAALLIILVIIMFPLFAHLAYAPMNIWDEARLANSALEMIQNNNWLVVKFGGQPDMWSTKPPLMIWLQSIFMKLVGINELAIRLPSALAGLATALMLFFFVSKKYSDKLAGVIAALVLITSHGFLVLHGTRSGDYDALLTLMLTGYAIYYFEYLETGKTKHLYVTFLMLTGALLTKGIQGTLFLPALFLYTVYKRRVFDVLKTKAFYIGVSGCAFFVLGYYLLREHYNPGYIAAVRDNELGGRFAAVKEGHNGDEWYYYDLIIRDQFKYWYLLLIPGVAAGLLNKQEKIKEVALFSLLLVLVYFMVITVSATKLDWYTMPLFPFLSVLVAILIYSCCKILLQVDEQYRLFSYSLLPFFFLFLLFIRPYQEITAISLSKDYAHSPERQEQVDMGEFMKEVLHNQRNVDGYMLLNKGIDQDVMWYYKALNYLKRPLKLSTTADEIDPQGRIVVYVSDAKEYIESHYNTEVLQQYKSVKVYKLNGLKEVKAGN